MSSVPKKDHWLAISIDLRIRDLHDYLQSLHGQLDRIAEDHRNRIDEQARSIVDPDERQQFLQFSTEDQEGQLSTFPRILLNSFHLATYALMESELVSLCNGIGRKQNQVFSVTDLGTRDYLGTSSIYIEKLTGVRPQGNTSLWESLTFARRLRNLIVHSDGVLIESKDIAMAKENGFLDESEYKLWSANPIQRLSLSYDYCESFLKAIKDFFHTLYSATASFL